MSVRIPLFPLENVVLFPDGSVPLHIFEPRYRQMTEAALAGDRRIGMVAVRAEHAAEVAGDPPLYEIGCAGFIAEHQRLADGRFHLLLQAVHRFRVLREVPREGERLYRLAEVEPLGEALGDKAAALRSRDRAIELLARIAERSAQGVDRGQLAALAPGRFASGVAQALSLPAREKQALLEAETLAERLDRLASALDFHLALLERHAARGPETLH